MIKKYNCILVYDKDKSKILFCKRVKPPYQGLLNLVGGKVEEHELGIDAAYRELYEETGIQKIDIELTHLMDMVYYKKGMELEIYGGVLKGSVCLVEEFQQLCWIDADTNFFDDRKFAGDGNIGHIVRQME